MSLLGRRFRGRRVDIDYASTVRESITGEPLRVVSPARNIVIIFGAAEPLRREQMALDFFKCTRTVPNWDGQAPLQPGDLAWTDCKPPFRVPGARAISAQHAKSAIHGETDLKIPHLSTRATRRK